MKHHSHKNIGATKLHKCGICNIMVIVDVPCLRRYRLNMAIILTLTPFQIVYTFILLELSPHIIIEIAIKQQFCYNL